MKSLFKNTLRPCRDMAYAAFGFMYDFTRFVRHAGYKTSGDDEKVNYKAVKIYHRLEKSLSFRVRNKTSGWAAANDLVFFLKKNKPLNENSGFQEKVALKVLSDFVSGADIATGKHREVESFLNNNRHLAHDVGGVIDYRAETLKSGVLEDPENFFFSRYSVRDFSSVKVSPDQIKRVINLSLKTPSVCSRQAWHVYHIDNRDFIDEALKYQNGNRGFGHEIPCLLIITADLKAFDTAAERYQHWIDGGMFSMSIVMALHSLGIGSCCLNWSKGPIDDMRFRKKVAIKPSHTILMMLAVGYPKDDLKVCYSARRPSEEIYTYIN